MAWNLGWHIRLQACVLLAIGTAGSGTFGWSAERGRSVSGQEDAGLPTGVAEWSRFGAHAVAKTSDALDPAGTALSRMLIMRLAVEEVIHRSPEAVFDFIGREHWHNHPRWDPNVIEMTPLTAGPIGMGSRARVRRRRGGGQNDEILEVIAFEPNSRWASRTQIGPFSLEMTALITPVGEGMTRLRLVGDTQARQPIRFLLPVLAIVFRRQMRGTLQRIKRMLEGETSHQSPDSG